MTRPITVDESQRRAARLAAFLYFAIALIAPIGLMYVPGRLIVPADAVATASNVRASEWLLRAGIGSEVVHQTIGIFLVLALYRLFKPINERLAVLMVILSLVPVPIMFANVLNELMALRLYSGAPFLSVFDQRQLDALALAFLRLHGQGIVVASIFWGLWLFPFGLLVRRSGFIPRILGVLLIVAGLGYLAASAATLFLPEYASRVGSVAIIMELGELPIIVWLLFRGTRLRTTSAAVVNAG